MYLAHKYFLRLKTIYFRSWTKLRRLISEWRFGCSTFLVGGELIRSIYISLKRQSRWKIEQNNSSRNHVEEERLLKEKKFLQTIISIASIAVFSFIPGWISTRVFANRIVPVDNIRFQIISHISNLLLVINFAINPLIYFIRFPNYRRTFKILYCRRWHQCLSSKWCLYITNEHYYSRSLEWKLLSLCNSFFEQDILATIHAGGIIVANGANM